MINEEVSKITKLQKNLLIKHLDDMNIRLGLITEETSYLMANIKAMKIILDEKNI
jgi:hypothetical protein